MIKISDKFIANYPSKMGRPNKYNDHIINVNRYVPGIMVKETMGKSTLHQKYVPSIEDIEEMEYRPKV